MVRLVDGADIFPHLLKAQSRVKISEQIVGLGGNTLELVAEANIKSYFLGDAPIVLCIPGVKPLGHIAGGVAREEIDVMHIPPEKVL